ncbi:MAG TPA: flagellar motor switch protein FliN [Candidatus Acidoferrales bacterium]|nr:flagellar motor switch protein FliN [Candidatus Acidoferrales bacterium]HTX57798.1 flagellar motor switch protein FliN [Candidatus Acidoferrales bacterium]
MPDTQQLADAMLASAGTVLGRLVEQSASVGAATRNDHDGSIRTDGDELVSLATIPSLGAQLVVRFPTSDMQKIVGVMLGGGDEVTEMGPMQLSIASETVSQIASAMVEELAKQIGTSAEGAHASMCTDATLLPPPPFVSYSGKIDVGSDLHPKISVDFAAITLSKLGLGASASAETAKAREAEAAPPPRRSAPAPANAQNVAYTAIAPTPVRTAQPGQANLDLVHDVPLQISAVLGKTVMPLREVVSLQSGSVFELDKLAAEPIDLYVNNILIARGEVVVVDDKYAVKISELNPQTSS